ncbi:MAG: hypothetical protein Q8R28_06395, partial [Dehalococcoidia bacterium]|nr:hypothetical protein [Dehalococcoidia bacterium]
PNPVAPTGYAAVQPGDVLDLRIQTVWPHDAQGSFAPVDRAPLVNVAVDLLAHGTLASVPPEFQPLYGPLLSMAEGNNVIDSVGIKPGKITYTIGGQTFPRWVFNDVPVQPGHQYNFLAQASTDLKKLSQFTTIWTHAADARTYLPNPQPPPPCSP